MGRGEPVQRVAGEFGIDRKTVREWQKRGRYQPRASPPRWSMLNTHAAWSNGRTPKVDFNSTVLHRELVMHLRVRSA